MLTRLLDNLLKSEHHAGLKNWADELFSTARKYFSTKNSPQHENISPQKILHSNIALHLVLIKKSELNFSDKYVFPQISIDVF